MSDYLINQKTIIENEMRELRAIKTNLFQTNFMLMAIKKFTVEDIISDTGLNGEDLIRLLTNLTEEYANVRTRLVSRIADASEEIDSLYKSLNSRCIEIQGAIDAKKEVK